MRTTSDTLTRIALGAAGGLAGTLAIQALMAVSRKALPGSSPPMRGNPGQYMVEQAEEILPESVRERIPDAAESAAAQVLGLGYGVTFGALYAALRPRGGDPLTDGAILGAVCWAAGYLGWLPALGLMPPVGQQTAEQVLVPAAEHVAYGVTTVAAYDWLREQV
jgi:hypothetical protein